MTTTKFILEFHDFERDVIHHQIEFATLKELEDEYNKLAFMAEPISKPIENGIRYSTWQGDDLGLVKSIKTVEL